MSRTASGKPRPCKSPRSKLTVGETRYWLARLREARASALADAEGFDSILFTLEALGQFLCKESGAGLNDYKPVSEVVQKLDSRPVLVVREVNGCAELVGLVTAFDLL